MPCNQQWNLFITKLKIKDGGISCHDKTHDLLFDPVVEEKELIDRWLHYRGIKYRQLSESDRLKVTILDMQHRGNSPSIASFRFNPSIASQQFLKLWLSWYGVTSEEKNKQWWEERVKSIIETHRDSQRLQTKKETSTHTIIDEFVRLHRLRIRTDQHYQDINRSTEVLLPAHIDLLASAPDKSEQWDTKRILALALDASAIAIPFIIKHNKSYFDLVGAHLSPGAILALKTVGVLLSSDRISSNILEKKQKTFWGNVQERGKIELIKAAQAEIKYKTKNRQHLRLGQNLLADVSNILLGKSGNVPTNVLKEIAKRHIKDNPFLLAGFTNFALPLIDSATLSGET